jgi:hypothetical protein
LSQTYFHRAVTVGHERAKGQTLGGLACILQSAKLQHAVMRAQNRRADINQNICGAAHGRTGAA